MELKNIKISELNLTTEQLEALTEERRKEFMSEMSDCWNDSTESKRLTCERVSKIVGFEVHSYKPDFYKADDTIFYYGKI